MAGNVWGESMADEADRADQEVEFLIQEQIRAAQTQCAPALKPKGKCHYCDEILLDTPLFCDKACHEDYQVEQAQLKRMGRRS